MTLHVIARARRGRTMVASPGGDHVIVLERGRIRSVYGFLDQVPTG